jgi:hypothetical protein
MSACMTKLSSKISAAPLPSSRINVPPPKAVATAVKPALSAAVDRFEAAAVPSAAGIAAGVRSAREAAAAMGARPGAGATASAPANAAIPGLFVGPGHSSPVKWMPGMGAGSGSQGSDPGTIGGNQHKPQGPMDPGALGPTASPFDRRGLVSNAPGVDTDKRDNVAHGYENLQRDNNWNAQPDRPDKHSDVAPDAPTAHRGPPPKLDRSTGPGARPGGSATSGPVNLLPNVNPLGPDPEFTRATGTPLDLHRNRFVGPGANPGRDPLIG